MLREFLKVTGLATLVLLIGEMVSSESYFSEGVANGLGVLIGDYIFLFFILSSFVFVGLLLWHGRSAKRNKDRL